MIIYLHRYGGKRMTYDQDWDRRLNPFRYNADGSLTDAAKRQNVTMELNSAGSNGGGGAGHGGRQASVLTAVLEKTSTALEDLRADTDKVDQKARDATSDASSSLLDGWKSGLGLSTLGRRWGDGAGHLSQMLSEASSKLHNTGVSYKDADHAERARMESLGGGKH
ncbi:hypothetical protein T261_7032 [Streptomyces lydicus]|nr:hypothetical protein T261_7032 [Streptomyces lydicus]